MNPSPLEGSSPPPSYDVAGSTETSMQPLTGAYHGTVTAWPSAAVENKQRHDEESGLPSSGGIFGGDARRRGGYTAIPVEPGQDDSDGSIDASLTSTSPLRVRVHAREGCTVRVDASEAWVQDANQLLRFVVGERPILPPTIMLRFTFARSNTPEASTAPLEGSWTKVFSFTVPIKVPAFKRPTTTGNRPSGDNVRVPAIEPKFYESPNTGLLRAVEDGVPCLRLSPLSAKNLFYDHSERKNVRQLSEKTEARIRVPLGSANLWLNAVGMSGAVVVEGAKGDVKVPGKIATAWNLMRKRGLKEPWCGPPQEDEQDASAADTVHSSATTLPSSTEAQIASRQAVQKALEDFVAAPLRGLANPTASRAKIMVFDQMPFGWDLSALENAIQHKIIDRLPQAHNTISRVFVTYQEIDPWLELQVMASKAKSFLPMNAGAKKSSQPDGLVGLIHLNGFLLIWIILSSGVISKSDSIVAWAANILFCFGFAFSVSRSIQSIVSMRGNVVSDTVMLAHPLKAWQHTNCSPSLSREEVVRGLFGQDTNMDGKSSDVQLSRRSDGWYVLRGIREGDWLRDHLQFLEEVVRLRKSGDLSEALAAYHAQRTAYATSVEENDVTGL